MSASSSSIPILYASPGFCVVNKPPDVAMDSYGQDQKFNVEGWVKSDAGQVALTAAGALVVPKKGKQEDEDEEQKKMQQDNDDDDDVQEKTKHKKPAPALIDNSLRFVHQLDYATSGLLCLAFAKRVAQKLAFCFESRQPKKEYLALVHGWISPEEIIAAKQHRNITAASSPPFSPFDCCKILVKKNDSAAAERNDDDDDHVKTAASSPPSSDIVDEDSVGALSLEQVLSHFPPEMRKISSSSSSSLRRLLISCPIGNDPTDEKSFRMRAVFPSSPPAEAPTAAAAAASGSSSESDQNRRQRDADTAAAAGKPASTILTVVSHGFLKTAACNDDDDDEEKEKKPDDTKISLIHLQLLTGRRHQLRVHCGSVLGAPIVGDITYSKNAAAEMSTPRMMLHAWRIAVPESAISASADAQEEKQQHKNRRRDIKQVRRRAVDSAVPDLEEPEKTISFIAPEPLTKFFMPV